MIDHYPQISLLETARVLRRELSPNFDDLGLDGDLAEAGHIAMLLAFDVDGLLVRDLAPTYIACVLGLDPEFCSDTIAKIKELGLEDNHDNWICEGGDMSFLLDMMTVTGILDRAIIDGEISYRAHSDDPIVRDPDLLYPGDKVVHRSGRGSGWYVKEVKSEDGEQLVRLIKSRVVGGPGGRWWEASNYVKTNG